MADYRGLGFGSGGNFMTLGDVNIAGDIIVEIPLTVTLVEKGSLTGTLVVSETLTATIRCLNP